MHYLNESLNQPSEIGIIIPILEMTDSHIPKIIQPIGSRTGIPSQASLPHSPAGPTVSADNQINAEEATKL